MQTIQKRGNDLLITDTDIDATILTYYMMLSNRIGVRHSLGMLFQTRYNQTGEFSLPDNLEPVNILVIGYGNETPADPERHSATRIPMEELVTYDYL